MADQLTTTKRTTLRRRVDRGHIDRALVDEAYLAHVGFVVDGLPRVLPMTYGRDRDVLYLHGAAANAMLRASTDAEICVTITLLDGLVLARAAMSETWTWRCGPLRCRSASWPGILCRTQPRLRPVWPRRRCHPAARSQSASAVVVLRRAPDSHARLGRTQARPEGVSQ